DRRLRARHRGRDAEHAAGFAGRVAARGDRAAQRGPRARVAPRPVVCRARRRERAVRAGIGAPDHAGRARAGRRRDRAARGGARGAGSGRAGAGAGMSTPAWRRRLKVTKLGWWFMGLTLGIGLAAINTGNNLLFLVLGMLLASIVISGVLSEQSLREVRIERRLPAGAAAGQPALIGLVARNGKKRAPSFSLELREKGGDIQGRGFLVVLGAQQTAEIAYRFLPHRRGRHRFEQL